MNIDEINLSCIFHDPLIQPALPNASAHFDTKNMICTLKKWDPKFSTLCG